MTNYTSVLIYKGVVFVYDYPIVTCVKSILLHIQMWYDFIYYQYQGGEEKVKIERPQANMAPVWAVSWNPNK